MRILTVHNYPGDYASGGEGNVFEAETCLLRAHGHEVKQFQCTNAEFMQAGLFRRAKAFIDAPWSSYGYKKIQKAIREFQPDLIHVHNFFFVLSPSIFRAAKDMGVPTVVTLHNFRFISPCSQLLRNGQICELCLNKNPWRIMWYRCYRESFLDNLLRYRIYYSSKKKYGWLQDIDAFISLTDFGKKKYIEGGLPQSRIYIKPNFIDDPGYKVFESGNNKKYGALFVGRISPEKGIATLLKAWRGIDYPLRIVGDGPQMEQLQFFRSNNCRFEGFKKHTDAIQMMKEASFLIFPSESYEGFPLTILEAMASGTPVLATDLGPRKDIVVDGKTGLLFRTGDFNDLREKAEWFIAHPELCDVMGKNAREEFLAKYTAEKNYPLLMNIYYRAIENHQSSRINVKY
jgi:glycosyltransferase involved in cell wall biosynthesis